MQKTYAAVLIAALALLWSNPKALYAEIKSATLTFVRLLFFWQRRKVTGLKKDSLTVFFNTKRFGFFISLGKDV